MYKGERVHLNLDVAGLTQGIVQEGMSDGRSEEEAVQEDVREVRKTFTQI